MPRFLVVDDEAPVADMLCKVLHRTYPEAEIIVHPSPADAMRALVHYGTFDLIFSDYQMPGKTGLDFYAHVRKTLDPRTGFLFASSIGPLTIGQEDARFSRIKSDEHATYLHKPFGLAEFRAAIRLLLPAE